MSKPVSGSHLLSGIFCLDCEYLEDESSLEDDRCIACGCPKDQHVPATVVAD